MLYGVNINRRGYNPSNTDFEKNDDLESIVENITYINGSILYDEASNILIINTISNFIKLIDVYNIKVIFVSSKDFIIHNDGILFIKENNDYKTLKDFIKGELTGFPNGKEYYNAKKMGFEKYEEYQLAKNNKYYSKKDYLDSKKKGFENSFKTIAKIIDEGSYHNDEIYDLEYELKTDGDIYYFAKENNFPTFEDLKNALSKGFLNYDDFNKCNKLGFENSKKYYDAKKMGFEKANEYLKALDLGIKSKVEYDCYSLLSKIKKIYSLKTFDEALLFKILLSLDGESIAINKLYNIFEENKELYVPRRGMEYYPEEHLKWFTEKFNNIDKFTKYLNNDNKLKDIGEYNPHTGVFKIKITKSVQIIVDGSNVAWNNGDKNKGDKPDVKYIELVIKELNKSGYNNIMVITDANLEYEESIDKEKLEKLKNKGMLEICPSKNDADEYIIKFAKEHNAKIISNDKYRDWKKENAWVKENIDKYIVSFMIDKHDKVILGWGNSNIKNRCDNIKEDKLNELKEEIKKMIIKEKKLKEMYNDRYIVESEYMLW